MRALFDIGHGSDTFPPSKGIYLPGGGKFEEHDFNSAVGLAAKKLAEHNDIEVIFSQEPYQKDVPLTTRGTDINNEHRRKHFDALISFHANYSGDPKASGYGVFHWHSSKNGKKLATIWDKYAKEILPIGPWGSGIWQSKLNDWTNFYILRETLPPAILIEHFFFSNLEELKKCNSAEFIEKAAEVTVKTLCEYGGKVFKSIGEEEKETNKLYKVQVGTFSNKDNADNLLMQLEYKGFEGLIIEEDAEIEVPTKPTPKLPVKEDSKYYIKHDLAIIETDVENIYISTLPGKNLRQFGVYGINGTWQNNAEAHLSRSIWGLAVNGGKPIGPNSHQNSPNGTKRGTLICYEDNTIVVRQINNVGEIDKPVKWAIGGGSLLPYYDPSGEKIASDILRYTMHTGIGFKGDKVFLFVTTTMCSMGTFRERVRKLNLDGAIFLDGGGSSQLNWKGNKGLYSSRPLSHGVFVKGVE